VPASHQVVRTIPGEPSSFAAAPIETITEELLDLRQRDERRQMGRWPLFTSFGTAGEFSNEH
jgi:hypothetical protein